MSRWAEQYIRVPFLNGGRDHKGCDCWGLYRLILLEQAGIELPIYADHAATGVNMARFRTIAREQIGKAWQEIEPGNEQRFDCVLMRAMFEHEKRVHSRPVHIGCVVRPGQLIHVEEGANTVISDYRRDFRLKSRVVGFYRVTANGGN